MKKLFAIALLALGACNPMNTTPDEKRWASLKGETVYVTNSPSMLLHASPNCGRIQGDVLKCKIDGDRVVDSNGTLLNSGREKPPFCVCVP